MSRKSSAISQRTCRAFKALPDISSNQQNAPSEPLQDEQCHIYAHGVLGALLVGELTVVCVRSGLTTSKKGVEYTWFRERNCCSTLLDSLNVYPVRNSVLFLTGSFTAASFPLVAGSYEHRTLCLEDRRTDTFHVGGDNAVNLRRGVQATVIVRCSSSFGHHRSE
jgi:hypothetical protein